MGQKLLLFWSFWPAISKPGWTRRKKVPSGVLLRSTRQCCSLFFLEFALTGSQAKFSTAGGVGSPTKFLLKVTNSPYFFLPPERRCIWRGRPRVCVQFTTTIPIAPSRPPPPLTPSWEGTPARRTPHAAARPHAAGASKHNLDPHNTRGGWGRSAAERC